MNEQANPPESRDGASADPAGLQRSCDEFENTSEARHLQRLLADLDLVNDLRVAGFDGPKFTELVRAFAQYGYQVIGAWIRTGEIFRQVNEKKVGHFLTGYPRRVPPTLVAKELTNDVVAEGIVSFRENVLKPGLWDHRLGASLATYFIGHCVHRFPKLYIEWCRTASKDALCASMEALPEEAWPGADHQDTERLALRRVHLEDGRAQIPHTTLAIIELVEQGYSHLEIQHLLGVSVKGIESRLHRHKKACEKRRALDDSA